MMYNNMANENDNSNFKKNVNENKPITKPSDTKGKENVQKNSDTIPEVNSWWKERINRKEQINSETFVPTSASLSGKEKNSDNKK